VLFFLKICLLSFGFPGYLTGGGFVILYMYSLFHGYLSFCSVFKAGLYSLLNAIQALLCVNTLMSIVIYKMQKEGSRLQVISVFWSMDGFHR
jgi:hypothetical protein